MDSVNVINGDVHCTYQLYAPPPTARKEVEFNPHVTGLV